MRVDVRDSDTRQRIGWVELDPADRPTKVPVLPTPGPPDSPDSPPPAPGREVFLHWDAALDDAGKLRKCLICGGHDLFIARIFPQLTGFVVVLAFAGAAIGILGLAENPLVLALLVIVLIMDIASFTFRKHRLVCYRCRTSYANIEISRHFRPFDRAVAERYPPPRKEPSIPSTTASAPSNGNPDDRPTITPVRGRTTPHAP